MNAEYEAVIESLRGKGIRAEFHRPHQLVLPSRVWITLNDMQWFISTWVPACYPIPPSVNVVDVCEACLLHGPDPFYTIPDEICARFGLTRIYDEQMEQALSQIPADEEADT